MTARVTRDRAVKREIENRTTALRPDSRRRSIGLVKPAPIRLASRSGTLGLAAAIAVASPAAAAAVARSGASPSAALRPGAPRPGAPGADAVFTGRTGQGKAVRLGRLRGKSRVFKYQARLSCSDDSTFTDDPFTDVVRLHGRRFSLRRSTDAGAVHVRLTGVLQGRRAHGTIRITERYSEVPDAHGDTPLNADGGILCDSGIVHWKAKLVRG
jgi:hypothetical protein